MFKRRFAFSLALAITAGGPVLAANCAQRDHMVERLQSKFAERFAMGGLQRARNSLSILEVWASDETGTYTVLLTDPSGVSCIVAAGTDFFEATRESVAEGTAG